MSRGWIRFWNLACTYPFVAGAVIYYGSKLAVFDMVMLKPVDGTVLYAVAR